MNNLTVTGVDLGSSGVKIAAVLKGGVQIITNQANFRQTPNVIGFGQNQRMIGQQGQVKIKTNHLNTIIAPSRFLGFNNNSDYVNQQLRFSSAKADKTLAQGQRLKFNVSYLKQKQSFYPQQLVASYITEIQKIISQTNNLSNKNMVMAVPSYFSQQQRKALHNAIQITKKKLNNFYPTQFVDQQIAISMDYGYAKRNDYSQNWNQSKNVLFIDFGHSKINAFVTAFNKQHLRVLVNKFDRQLGCKFLDQQIIKFYAKIFDDAHPNIDLNLLQSRKATLKLLDAVQKQRKILSGINQHELSLQCLLQDEDLFYSMKRQQYEKICSPIIQKFKNLLRELFDQLKQKNIQFDEIQLVGGGTRIPIVIKSINQIFDREISRTINSSQCIAKGAGLISAMDSLIFKVNQYAYFNINSYSVNLKVNQNLCGKKLIEKNQFILKDKIFQFQVNSQIQKFIIKAEYDQQQLQKGLQRRIFQVFINLKNQKMNQKMELQSSEANIHTIKLKLKINIDEFGLINFENLSTQNKQWSIKVLKIQNLKKFTIQEINKMEQKQKQMTIRDFRIKKFYEKKNEYESFIYKCKQKVQNLVNNNKQFTQMNQINQIMNMLSKQQNQLYQNQQALSHLNSQDFTKKQQIISSHIDNFISQVNQIRHLHQKLDNQILKLSNYINQIITKKKSQNMYPQQVNRIGQWINSIIQQQKQSPKYNKPIISFEEIQNVFKNLTHKMAEFDQKQERQRLMSQRSYKKPTQRHTDDYYRSYQEPNYNPFRSSQSNYFQPRTTRRGGSKHSNPFGSRFFGNDFNSFF